MICKPLVLTTYCALYANKVFNQTVGIERNHLNIKKQKELIFNFFAEVKTKKYNSFFDGVSSYANSSPTHTIKTYYNPSLWNLLDKDKEIVINNIKTIIIGFINENEGNKIISIYCKSVDKDGSSD